MKAFLIFTFLIFISASSSAQEKYFHELKGMEDSTGTTHLFYRLFEKTTFQCSEDNGGLTITSRKNNVYHLNTELLEDTVKFGDYYSPWCLDGYYTSYSTGTYTFIENDPSKFLYTSFGDYCSAAIVSYTNAYFDFYTPCLIKQNSGILPITWENLGLIPDFRNGKLMSFFWGFDSFIELPLNPNEWPIFEWEDYEGFEDSTGVYFDYIESVKTGFEIIAIHPNIDSIYYAKNITDSIKASSYEIIIPDLNINKIRFDSTPSIVYSIQFESSYLLSISDNFGRKNSWKNVSLPNEFGKLQFLEIDTKNSGYLIIADSTYIYSSSNYGEAFEPLSEMDYRITGLYKKPNSDILYVLTTDELFEVNTESKDVTSLKKLPVSIEEPKEIPTSVTLHQNYPNPFNPSTTISFELNNPAEVTLTVFDALGRTIATLVNERKSTGLHTVNFDASNLSSGIYFYRLETGNFVETKRLTLIK